ncbi:MAG: hypothetical protein LBH80_00790 [Prevotellaceae bacterium]|nr:hypothetical protein [Prevotellaceae bacterium]
MACNGDLTGMSTLEVRIAGRTSALHPPSANRYSEEPAAGNLSVRVCGEVTTRAIGLSVASVTLSHCFLFLSSGQKNNRPFTGTIEK